MAQKFPVITIQCDWNEVIRLPNSKAWISSKFLDKNSVHDELTTSVNPADGKIKVNLSDHYQYISHTNLSLVVKHLSGLKVAFVCPTKVYKLHTHGVYSVDAAENSLAVSSCEGDKLYVWDSRTGEQLQDLRGHAGAVYKCRLFPSGVVALSAGADMRVRVWSAESGLNPVTLLGHTMAVCDLAIIERGRNVVTVSRDGMAKLWDVGESRCLANVVEGHGPINCCAVAAVPDEVEVANEREIGTGNKLLVVGCESGAVVAAHIGRRQQVFVKQLEAACNACVVLDQLIVLGCSDGKVIQLNLDGTEVGMFHESASPVLSLAALPRALAVGRQDGTLTVAAADPSQGSHGTPTRVQLTGSDCDGIRDVSFNGKWIFSACRDSNVRKYDYNQVLVHFR